MDNYRILLAGRNKTLIDHIFMQMDDEYECMTTSSRPEDILNHINAIRYDAFIYCVQKEDREDYSMIMGYKDRFLRKGTTVFVMGYKEECENFQKTTGHMAANAYYVPVPMNDVKNAIREAARNYFDAMAALDAEMRMMESAPEPEPAPEAGITAQVSEASDKTVDSEEPKPAPEPASETEAPAPVPASESETPAPEPDRKKILVIDDDPMVLKLIQGHLGDEYDIASAISGKVAYKYLSSKSVDLILLDYEMPEENGPMVYENIRKMEGDIKNVPIVFLTGVTERDKLVKAIQLKPNGYLPKPINGTKLTNTVSKLIG